MSGIRFSSFGAATMPLSKIVPDADFDMRPYGITAALARAPYRPIGWETEELDWGDVAPTETLVLDNYLLGMTENSHTVMTVSDASELVFRVTVIGTSQASAGLKLRCNGTDIATTSEEIAPGASYDFPAFVYNSGDIITLYGRSPKGTRINVTSVNTGRVVTAKTFNLTGKWLELGIDMNGLAATVKIQGVEIPYSDYGQYFPLAPSELTIPGDWDTLQTRPVVRVYK